MGDHMMNAGVRAYQGEEDYAALKQELIDPYERADFAEVIRILDRHFGESTYSLRSIFKDDQREIMETILKSTVAEAETVYRGLYERHAPMMRFMTDINIPLPRAFQVAADFALNSSLRNIFESPDTLDFVRIGTLLDEVRANNLNLDGPTLGFALKKTLRRLSEQFLENPRDMQLLSKFEAAAGVARNLPFEVNVWRAQNNYYTLMQQLLPEMHGRALTGDAEARAWVDHFVALGQNLAVKVDLSTMTKAA